MGDTQTLNIAFAHLDWFSTIGIFSLGILGHVAGWEKSHLGGPRRSEAEKRAEDDLVQTVSKASVATFQESTGAHTWVNWRNYLYQLAPQLFR